MRGLQEQSFTVMFMAAWCSASVASIRFLTRRCCRANKCHCRGRKQGFIFLSYFKMHKRAVRNERYCLKVCIQRELPMLSGRTKYMLLLIVLGTMFMHSHVSAQNEDALEDVLSRMKPYAGPHNDGVDVSTLKGKIMCGYQGWFAAEGDGSGRGWFHYAAGHNVLKPGQCTFDLWPCMSEMDDDEKFSTPFKHRNGDTAYLFSPYIEKTVVRHFQWMKEYGIDGVFLQRFGSSLKSAKSLNHRNFVTANVQSGANRFGRTWAMMYDLSGLQAGDIEKVVIEDWKHLVDNMEIIRDKSYLHHNGKPVVAVWGIGFNDNRKYTLEECEALVRFLKNDSKYGGNTVMIGVPARWRDLNGDSVSDKRLHEIILQADIISPWTVGRYRSPQGARAHAESLVRADIDWTRKRGLDYLPVAFPGFSWQNLMKTHGKNQKLNEIPRQKGLFLWSQFAAFKEAGADMIYVAMFDEIDEGTAIFKCSNNPPVGESRFLTYEGLPSDHYLWLAGKAGELLRGEIRETDQMPVRDEQRSSAGDAQRVAPEE